MNIPFAALVIFCLALPGLTLKRALGRPDGRLRLKPRWPDDLLRSIVFAAFIHLISVCLANVVSPLTHVTVDLEAAVALAAGKIDWGESRVVETTANGNAEQRPALWAIAHYPGFVLAYFAFACGLGAFTGRSLRYLERKYAWCRTIGAFIRSENQTEKFEEWSTLFYGLPEEEEERTAFRVLSTVVTMGGTAYLFVGELVDIYPDEHGDPELFLLRSASRRPLEDDDAGFYEIDGDGMILRLAEMTTLNVCRFRFRDDVGGSEDSCELEEGSARRDHTDASDHAAGSGPRSTGKGGS